MRKSKSGEHYTELAFQGKKQVRFLRSSLRGKVDV
jgi:hypothetical protein